MCQPGLFFVIFGLFQRNINTILQQINVKKCPSSIRHRDSNPRPSEHESLPITTRPGLPPQAILMLMFSIETPEESEVIFKSGFFQLL